MNSPEELSKVKQIGLKLILHQLIIGEKLEKIL
jgi:hypothetical protein